MNFYEFEFHFSSFTGSSNARNDGMTEISLTYSTCLVYIFQDPRAFDFSDSKAIVHCRSANFDEFL